MTSIRDRQKFFQSQINRNGDVAVVPKGALLGMGLGGKGGSTRVGAGAHEDGVMDAAAAARAGARERKRGKSRSTTPSATRQR